MYMHVYNSHGVFYSYTMLFLEHSYDNVDILQVWLSPHLQIERFQCLIHTSEICLYIVF